MFTKAKIMNLALQALLLSRQISDPNSDRSNEAKILNEAYDVAFKSALFDMDLDSTASLEDLELLAENPTALWAYAYKYPAKCAFFRRVVDPLDSTGQVVDDRGTHNPKRVMIYEGKKVIFTNVQGAAGEWIPIDFPLQTLSAPAGLTIALRLAYMAAPLIVGKGAKSLMTEIENRYRASKAEAQALDERESFSFQDDSNMSEFVKVRTT